MSAPVYVYRGVHAKHKMLPAALNGVVIPGEPEGDLTPEEHNYLDESMISPFTSWTYSLAVAQRFAARRGLGGVVLRTVKSEPEPHESWSWHDSPDSYSEHEVLLKGIRMELEVLIS